MNYIYVSFGCYSLSHRGQ